MSLTPKQEKFCQEYINTGNQSEAYRRAYNTENCNKNTINRKAKEVYDNVKVSARINELKNQLSVEYSKTREDIIKDLTDIIDQYKRKGSFTQHTLKAIEILNKMLGWNEPEKHNITHQGIIFNIIKPEDKNDN